MTNVNELFNLLHDHTSGPLDLDSKFGETVLSGLVAVWPSLDGSNAQSTTPEKLGRLERLTWETPLLKFRLERHGGTVMGSSRAAIHSWDVDLRTGTAYIMTTTHIQKEPRSKVLDVNHLAQKITSTILDGAKHPALIWGDTDLVVTIKLEVLIPQTAKQTTVARRKRFRDAIVPMMTKSGWHVLPKGNFLCFGAPVRADKNVDFAALSGGEK